MQREGESGWKCGRFDCTMTRLQEVQEGKAGAGEERQWRRALQRCNGARRRRQQWFVGERRCKHAGEGQQRAGMQKRKMGCKQSGRLWRAGMLR